MKIYTRKGDRGETSLFGGGRVSKSHPRVSAYGSVDELNSSLGWALTLLEDEGTGARLRIVQHDLFTLGSHLSLPSASGKRPRPTVPDLPGVRIEEMESWMDEAERSLEPLTRFILPGGSAGAAALHLARTVCRRAERAVVALSETEAVDAEIVRYLNRLSDLLFVYARLENARSGTGDVHWQPDAGSEGGPSRGPDAGSP